MTGTQVDSVSMSMGGIGYVMPSTMLSRITWALTNATCSQGNSAAISLSDRMPSTTTCAELRALVALAAQGWAASWPGVAFEDVSDACHESRGVVDASCSVLLGGDAVILVDMAPATSASYHQHHPAASTTDLRAPTGTSDTVHRIALHPPSNAPPAHAPHRRRLLPRGTLAVAYVHAHASSTWSTVDGRTPRYADGSAHSILATTGVLIDFSRTDFDWCAHEADACTSWAPRDGACIPVLTTMVHELGHALGLGHPTVDDHWRVASPTLGTVPLWSDVIVSEDFGGPTPVMRATLDTAASPLPTKDGLESLSVLYGLPIANWSALPSRAGCPSPQEDWHSADDDDDDDDWVDDPYDDDDDGGGVVAVWWWGWWVFLVFLVFCFPLSWYAWPVSDYSAQRDEVLAPK